MCEPCKKGITFEPEDLVVRKFRVLEWDFEKSTQCYYDGLQLGRVIAVHGESGNVRVQWGTKKNEEIEAQWCVPSNFIAVVRNGKYETIEELRDNPS